MVEAGVHRCSQACVGAGSRNIYKIISKKVAGCYHRCDAPQPCEVNLFLKLTAAVGGRVAERMLYRLDVALRVGVGRKVDLGVLYPDLGRAGEEPAGRLGDDLLRVRQLEAARGVARRFLVSLDQVAD